MILKILLFPVAIVLCLLAVIGELAEETYWYLYHKTDGGGWFW